MVLEPLNPWRDHPGQFLSKVPQAFEVCRAVNSPSCKILFDIYHQQITEGNIIPNINLAWSEIAYFQIGDNPGRNEPTTGEMNYRNLFRHIKAKGFDGILGLEHGRSYKDLKQLRYGRVMIMTDQDVDGSHIKGLIINLFHTDWPELLNLGFVCGGDDLVVLTRQMHVHGSSFHWPLP